MSTLTNSQLIVVKRQSLFFALAQDEHAMHESIASNSTVWPFVHMPYCVQSPLSAFRLAARSELSLDAQGVLDVFVLIAHLPWIESYVFLIDRAPAVNQSSFTSVLLFLFAPT